MNDPVKPGDFIVGSELGKHSTDGDSKQKWLVRMFVNRNQQIGLGVLFILIIITVWRFQTYGMAGVLSNWSTRHKTVATQPVELWLFQNDWSLPTYMNASQAWQLRTDPIEAVVEVQNAETGEVLRITTNSVPATWTQMKWRQAPDDPRQSVRLTLTPLH